MPAHLITELFACQMLFLMPNQAIKLKLGKLLGHDNIAST